MKKKIIGIFICILFFGVSFVPSIDGNIAELNEDLKENIIRNSGHRDILFSDDFNDNTKNFSKWTEIYNEGTWWERNQRTEFQLYESGGGVRKEGIESSEIEVFISSFKSVKISADMFGDIEHSPGQAVGKMFLRVTDGTNWIELLYQRNLYTKYKDSNDAGWTVLNDNFLQESWENTIEIYSDRYSVKMHEDSSGWIYDDDLFDSNPTLSVQIDMQLGGDFPSFYWICGFDNVIVEGRQENQPPYSPNNPNPDDGEIDVYINKDVVSWTGGDPDDDNVLYDVYFGNCSPPPKVESNQSDTTYDLIGLLEFETTYYWKIIAWDEFNCSTEGAIWSFTTEENLPPNTPSEPIPPDGETDVSIKKILRWVGGDPNPGDTARYDIYFGTSSPPQLIDENLFQTIYGPDTMDYNTRYYWQIVAKDSQGLTATGPIWHFTTELGPNSPPTKPDIYGSSIGTAGKELSWAFESDDPEDNQVKYLIDWGDETSEETDYHPDSTPVEVYHTYEKEGDYIIKAKAEDEKGLVSDESTFTVKITISRIRTVNSPLLLWLLERFPMLEVILRTINLLR